jgi:hypothetical protein
MSLYCPVCNGLEALSWACPSCQHTAIDYGRWNDYLGPYSPYRNIDEMSMTNGYPDLQNHTCVHVMSCPQCSKTFNVQIAEIEP